MEVLVLSGCKDAPGNEQLQIALNPPDNAADLSGRLF